MEHIINLFISNAYAQSEGAASQSGAGFSFILMFVVFFLFIYFAIWRPQSKRAKDQKNLLNSLAPGDEVVTAGGLLGKINKISENYLVLSVANQTDIIMQKSSVVSVLPKGTIKSIE